MYCGIGELLKGRHHSGSFGDGSTIAISKKGSFSGTEVTIHLAVTVVRGEVMDENMDFQPDRQLPEDENGLLCLEATISQCDDLTEGISWSNSLPLKLQNCLSDP